MPVAAVKLSHVLLIRTYTAEEYEPYIPSNSLCFMATNYRLLTSIIPVPDPLTILFLFLVLYGNKVQVVNPFRTAVPFGDKTT